MDAKASKKEVAKAKKKDKKKNKEPSITDVIAVELMEKVKKTLDKDPVVKREESRVPSPPPAPVLAAPEPPTPPRINSPSESEKEPEDDEFNIPTISEIKTSAGSQNLHKKELSQLQELQNRIYQTKKKLKDMSSESEEEAPAGKSSVLSRLGVKPTENSKPSNIISLSAIRRTEKEVYVAPSFRKLIERQKVENERRDDGDRRPRVSARHDRRSRSRERYERSRNRRERSRSPIVRSRSPKTRSTIHQRIGSRVKATPEKPMPIVKAKQRPTLSSAVTARAGKNLLLRAVAEAQRSTANVPSDARKRLGRDNIVVQVPMRKDRRNIRVEEEYVPESTSTQSETDVEYHPTSKPPSQDDGDEDVIYLNNNEDVEDLDNDEPRKSPQFVVTLEGATQFDRSSKSHSPTPPPVIKRKSIKDRIGFRPTVQAPSREERQPVMRVISQPVEEESESQRAYNRVKRARLSPIKFDLTDEEDDDRKSRNSSRDIRSNSPKKSVEKERKFEEIDVDSHAKRIKLETSRSFEHVPACKTRRPARASFSNHFHSLVLSSVAVPVPETAKPIVKSKDRCRFYPSCSNASCTFYHPTLPCKLFPNCKFGDTCAYVHPKCKFDTSCTRNDCNFSHTPAAAVGQTIPPIGKNILQMSLGS